MDVILHIGAHRTGSSTFQSLLLANKEQLRKRKIESWLPNRTRSGLLEGMFDAPETRSPMIERLARRSCGRALIEQKRLEDEGCQTLIVSDENMSGSMLNNLLNGALYPDVRQRLGEFSEAFSERCTKIALSIRSYETYWASVLAFRLPRGALVPSEGDLDRFVTQTYRWRDMITSVASVFPAAKILVWPFESFVSQPERQLAAMVGRPVGLGPFAHREWRNASMRGGELRQVLRDRGEFAAARSLPDGMRHWRPFGPLHSSVMRMEYEEDIAWLRRQSCGRITYLENTGTAAPHKAMPNWPGAAPEGGQTFDREERSLV